MLQFGRCRATLLQRICSWCQLHFIKCAETVLVSLLPTAVPQGATAQNGRPATVCRRPGSGTRVTPTPINDIASDGLTRPSELADLRMSILQLYERLQAKLQHLDTAGTGHPLFHCLCRYLLSYGHLSRPPTSPRCGSPRHRRLRCIIRCPPANYVIGPARAIFGHVAHDLRFNLGDTQTMLGSGLINTLF